MTTNSTDRANNARFNKICDKLEKSPECAGLVIHRRPSLSIEVNFERYVVYFENIGMGELKSYLSNEVYGLEVKYLVRIVEFYKRLQIICENLNTIDRYGSHIKFLDIGDFEKTKEYLLYDSGNNPYEPARVHSSKLYELFRNVNIREAIRLSFVKKGNK